MAHRIREAVLWLGAAAGLVAIAAGLAVAFGGFGFLVFRSGSMAPEIPTGGIALSRTVDAAEIRVGDVVSVTAANGERVTHRVVETTVRGDEASLVLQGDANETPDSELYVVESAERVVGSAPWGGYVVAHLLTPPGLVALGAVSLMLVLLTGDRRPGDEQPRPPAPGRRRKPPRHRGSVRGSRRLVAAVAVLAVAGGAGTTLARTTGTWATFTDAPKATSGSFASATVATPTLPATITQQTGTGAAPVSWTGVAVGDTTAQSYDVVRYTQATGGTGTVVCDDVTTTSCTEPKPASAASNTTYYYAIRANYGGAWTAESPTRRTYAPDVIVPTGTYSTPTPTTTSTSCSAALVCGTAADTGGGSVARVEFSLLRERSRAVVGGDSTFQCWTGSAYVAAVNNACPTYYLGGGTTSWTVPGARATAYAAAPVGYVHDFTLYIRLIDTYNNVRQSSAITY